MQVKRYMLDGRAIQSVKAFYDELARIFPLPEYFGRNLDALADVLTTDIEGPFEIVWEHALLSKKAMKGDYAKIIAVLKHVAAERDDFRIITKE
ncbi:MAG TPA: barstar family protein [Dissulfurispiraceae bacterium]|nr:barstar family protein [Dissulfurispiraceae bacterium]